MKTDASRYQLRSRTKQQNEEQRKEQEQEEQRKEWEREEREQEQDRESLLLWEQSRRELGQRIGSSIFQLHSQRPGHISLPSTKLQFRIEIQIGDMKYGWEGDLCGAPYEGATSVADGLPS